MKKVKHRFFMDSVCWICTALLLTSLQTVAQNRVVVKNYTHHNFICHFYYLTYEDYLLQLFSDSTIEISIYKSNSMDKTQALNLVCYKGRYSKKGDTIQVAYESMTSDTKYKNQPFQKSLSQVQAGKTILLPSHFFILKDSTIITSDNFFPTMHHSTSSDANELKYKFYTWDKKLQKLNAGSLADIPTF